MAVATSKNTLTYAWLIWLVASLFYSLEYLQRVAPTVMAVPLMQTFQIDAQTLSIIASLYFYAYAVAQIPVGLLLDRFGARRLLSLSCMVISVGSLLFAVSGQLWLLGIARVLIGFGSAFAFIGVLKLAASWFPEHRYPLMVGLTNTLGVIGAIFGQAPLAKLVEMVGWQVSMIILSLTGFAISALIWVTILDCPICLLHPEIRRNRRLPSGQLWQAIKDITSNAKAWIRALYAGLMVVPIIAFGELWAVPFLTQQYALTPVMAANINSAIFIGIGVGGPTNGWLASYLPPRLVMLAGSVGAFLSLLLIIYSHIPYIYLLFLLLFTFGFCTSSMLIAFTLNKQLFPREYMGSVAAFTNMVIVVLGAVFQDVIGYLLHQYMPVMAPNGYSIFAYHAALGILPMISVCCLVLWCFV